MINWKVIDNKVFEKIAYDYISNIYPDLKWTPTKATKDGNRDGYATINNPIGVVIKYWYEAKYSINTDKSIPKSHLDSTLVSSLLDGTVAAIAFITNAYISEDYRRRADIFSKKRDNLKIIYINGAELEQWFSQHPEIEDKYFHSNTAESQNLITNISDYCILEKYCLNGETFSKVKNIQVNHEYILCVSFYSTIAQKISIESACDSVKMINQVNKHYDNYKSLEANIGHNTFFVPIEAICVPATEIIFFIKTKQETFSIYFYNISVIDIYTPNIVYSSQLQIEYAIYSLISGHDSFNAVISILGDMGTGKSYLLERLIDDSRNPFSSYVISFYGDSPQDTISCYKIILMSLYGDIWNYTCEDEIFNNLNEMELSIYSQIVQNIVTGNSVEVITNYYKSNRETRRITKSMLQIFVDDFHKLSIQNQELLNEFFKWFMHQEYNCKIFVFSRPDAIPKIQTIQYELKNIKPEDVINSVKANFENNVSLLEIIKKHSLPLNILHLLVILSQIKECQLEWEGKTPLEMSVLINKIYTDSVSKTHATLGEQVLRKYKSHILIYCVYKIKTGISVDALDSFWGESILSDLFEMIKNRIVKEKNDNILPYHDILLTAFGSYNDEVLNEELEKFVVFAEKHNYISKAKFFSVLLGMGNKYFWKYRKEAELYRDKLHQIAAYHEALELSEIIEEINTKNLDDYSAKDCWNLFIKGNCIKYTDSHSMANVEFKKIRKIYEMTNDINILGIYLETETEIVNDYIWMLEIKEANKTMKKITAILAELYNHTRLGEVGAINAFLNFHNRRMFLNYMIDKGTEENYNLALSYSEKLEQKNYIAFSMIDYAKCLYFENISKAEKLLNGAFEIIKELDEPRRQLDIESELWFINCINKRKVDTTEYTNLLKMANLKHYTHTSTKIRLKFVLLEIVFSKTTCVELRNKLYSLAADNPSVTLGKRNQAFINHLLAATYYKEGNIRESIKFTSKCLTLFSELGNSYTDIHKNNKKLNSYNSFLLLHNAYDCGLINKTNKFILDTRLW
ncbi:MAG: hypothetical protein HFH72_07070 [Lachnospiraceae bacterium]|nr:hypothetical protein [Lachnospiraceae bacterium]